MTPRDVRNHARNASFRCLLHHFCLWQALSTPLLSHALNILNHILSLLRKQKIFTQYRPGPSGALPVHHRPERCEVVPRGLHQQPGRHGRLSEALRRVEHQRLRKVLQSAARRLLLGQYRRGGDAADATLLGGRKSEDKRNRYINILYMTF